MLHISWLHSTIYMYTGQTIYINDQMIYNARLTHLDSRNDGIKTLYGLSNWKNQMANKPERDSLWSK